MHTTDRYSQLQQQIAAAEADKAKATEQEKIRLAVEKANQQKIAAADQQLAQLRAAAAAEEFDFRKADAAQAADAAAVSVYALEDDLTQLISLIIDTISAPLASADRTYQAAVSANDAALAAASAQTQRQPVAEAIYDGAPEYLQREAQQAAAVASIGQARALLPAPLAPPQAALLGMARESDPQRRRIWSALHYILTGALAEAGPDYDPAADARQREQARTRRYTTPRF